MMNNIGYCYFQFSQEVLQLNVISLYKKDKFNLNNSSVIIFVFPEEKYINHKQVKDAEEHFICLSHVHTKVSKWTCCNFQNNFLQYLCGI